MNTEKKIEELESRMNRIEVGFEKLAHEQQIWIREFLINDLKGFLGHRDALGQEAVLGIQGLIGILRDGKYQEELK